jgi:hypothetical protein
VTTQETELKPTGVIILSVLLAGISSAALTLALRQPTRTSSASAPVIRTIEAGRDAQGCDADEELLNAYCYSNPPNSLSASTVSFRKGADGKMSLSCFTGGSNMRIVCMKTTR